MSSYLVVEPNVLGQTSPGLRSGLIGFQIHLLVFYRPPEPLNDHVIALTVLAIHANLYVVRFQEIGELQAGELTALIGVHDLWGTVFLNGFVHSLDTEVSVHGV